MIKNRAVAEIEFELKQLDLIESIEMDPVQVLSKDDGQAVVGWIVPAGLNTPSKETCHLL
jgi:hypothetical protein